MWVDPIIIHQQLKFLSAMLMFSLAGIPPLAGFFGKFFVFVAAIKEGLLALAIIGVLASVVGAYYYLRIVKIMYFDEPADSFDRPIGRDLAWITTVMAVFVLVFIAIQGPVVAGADVAAGTLFTD